MSKYKLKSTGDKYPASDCRKYMKEISNAGFSSIEEISNKDSLRKTSTFKKIPYDKLREKQVETLKKLNSSSSNDSFLHATASEDETDEFTKVLKNNINNKKYSLYQNYALIGFFLITS